MNAAPPPAAPPEDLGSRRRRAALEAARDHVGPVALLAVDLNNMKAFNEVAGHEAGDQVIAGAERELARLGPVWRVGGQRFVALVAGAADEVRRRVREVTWLCHVRVGATDAWEHVFVDGRPSRVVPHLAYEVVCNLRVGLGVPGADGDAARALALAEERCDRAAMDASLHEAYDFAPVVRSPWQRGRRLAEEGRCPLCHSDGLVVTDVDLGSQSERCLSCAVRYERVARTFVLGRT